MTSTFDTTTTTATVREADIINLLGARMQVVARMGDGNDETVLIRSQMGPEPRQVPLHAHADVESFYVLEGLLDIYIEDETPGWRKVAAGQNLTVPGNVRHAVRNSSGARVDSIMATTTRIARFFGEIATPPGQTPRIPPSADDIARVHVKAAEYGYWMGSSADNAALPA